ncbi:MAG: hypothetical protein CMJ31_00530 [Phycisphaerae bacterium]|nr:hypothetical protein [Phycisphaerae bacterium]
MRFTALGGLGLGLALSLAGCDSPIETTAATPYGGPPLDLTSSGPWHVIEAQAPSPGWKIDFEHSRPGPDAQEVFITVRRPDPQFVYPQVIVDQLVSTDVRTSEPIEIYARVVPHDQRGVGGTYHLVRTIEAAN